MYGRARHINGACRVASRGQMTVATRCPPVNHRDLFSSLAIDIPPYVQQRRARYPQPTEEHTSNSTASSWPCIQLPPSGSIPTDTPTAASSARLRSCSCLPSVSPSWPMSRTASPCRGYTRRHNAPAGVALSRVRVALQRNNCGACGRRSRGRGWGAFFLNARSCCCKPAFPRLATKPQEAVEKGPHTATSQARSPENRAKSGYKCAPSVLRASLPHTALSGRCSSKRRAIGTASTAGQNLRVQYQNISLLGQNYQFLVFFVTESTAIGSARL